LGTYFKRKMQRISKTGGPDPTDENHKHFLEFKNRRFGLGPSVKFPFYRVNSQYRQSWSNSVIASQWTEDLNAKGLFEAEACIWPQSMRKPGVRTLEGKLKFCSKIHFKTYSNSQGAACLSNPKTEWLGEIFWPPNPDWAEKCSIDPEPGGKAKLSSTAMSGGQQSGWSKSGKLMSIGEQDYSEKQRWSDTLENSYATAKKELAADFGLQVWSSTSVGSSAFDKKVKFSPCPNLGLSGNSFEIAGRRGFAFGFASFVEKSPCRLFRCQQFGFPDSQAFPRTPFRNSTPEKWIFFQSPLNS